MGGAGRPPPSLSAGRRVLKVCSRCREEKPLSEYYASKARPDGKQNNCKDCSRAYLQQWAHGGKATGACEICGAPARVQDHNHNCCPRYRSCELCRRGVLCQGCNLAIGHAQEDPLRLRAAADYLERWTGGLGAELHHVE